MPKKNDRPNKVAFTDVVWVLNNLTRKDMEVVDGLDVPVEAINNFLTELGESGGKLSFGWDYYSDCVSLSLMFMYEDFDNTGYATSARGADFEHCCKILMYKYYEVAKSKLYELSESRQKSPKYG